MKQYQDLLKEILANGTLLPNRTGVKALSIPGAMLKFDLREGFPAVTSKKLAFNAMKGELLGFLRGYTNAADFRALGCKIWDQNANENRAWLQNSNRQGHDDLGRIYGAQWVGWEGEDGLVNQVQNVLESLLHNPTDRRMIISAWKPDEFEQMALPPCHVLYQFLANPETAELHLCMYQRSADCGLGVPFNIASASLLLSLVAHVTKFIPATFTHFLADAHIYENHIEGVKQMLEREPLPLPKLVLDLQEVKHFDSFRAFKALQAIEPDQIKLDGYQSHPSVPMEMAV